jgi:hypothetical protein
VGCDPETIRNWGRKGRVKKRSVAGATNRFEYLAEDVLRAAGRPAEAMNPGDEAEARALRAVNAELRDRNTALEEVLRRYRHIDERRDEIDQWHREIEELLQGSAPVPNE